jgi:hypothetical protein
MIHVTPATSPIRSAGCCTGAIVSSCARDR